MKDSARPTGTTLPSELPWRIAILTALAIAIPLLRHGGAPAPGAQAAVANAASAPAGKGREMAGMLPGVSPITFGHTLHLPSDTQS